MSDILTKNDSPINGLLWTREEEELLKDWTFIANKFRWLHERSSLVFKNKNNKIALPVIMISTLTGTANFGINSLVPPSHIQTAQVVIGGANIFCGILTTVQTYFKYAENTEAHANASKLWAKFHNIISIELAIQPSKRKNPTVFLKFCIEEYNKLKEYSPEIPPEIATLFKSTFRRRNIKLPDIYDELSPIITYNDYVYRNITMEKDEPTIPKTSKSQNDSITNDKSDDIENGLKRLTAPFQNYTTKYKPTIKNYNQNIHVSKDNGKALDDESGISIENSTKVVDRYTPNQKQSILDELENVKPDIKGLINSLSKNIGNSFKSNIQINSGNNNETPSILISEEAKATLKNI